MGRAGRVGGARQDLLVPSRPGTHGYQVGHDRPHARREEEGSISTASFVFCFLTCDEIFIFKFVLGGAGFTKSAVITSGLGLSTFPCRWCFFCFPPQG